MNTVEINVYDVVANSLSIDSDLINDLTHSEVDDGHVVEFVTTIKYNSKDCSGYHTVEFDKDWNIKSLTIVNAAGIDIDPIDLYDIQTDIEE